MFILKLKKILSSVLAGAMLVGSLVFTLPASSADTPHPFTDVNAGAYYADAVSYVYKNGLMNGTTATAFAPSTAMSRAMFTTVLGRMCGISDDAEATDTFTDTDKNTWYSPFVGWANDSGIMQGYGGKFRPNDPITRQEAAVCVSRLITYLDTMLDYTNVSPDAYRDASSIAQDWAIAHVNLLSRYGIIQGDQNGNFNPTGTLDRAQGATILMRLHAKYLDATETAEVLNVWDFFNSPEMLLTNMLSEKDTSSALPAVKLTPCESDSAPWFFGVNVNYTDVPAGGMEYVKFAYKSTDSVEKPMLKLTSPIYSAELQPVAVETEDDFTTVIFETGDTMRRIRQDIFTEHEEYFDTVDRYSFEVDFPTYNSRYLRVELYPFGDKTDASATLLYAGFFSKLNDAKAYTAEGEADVYKNGVDVYEKPDFREATDKVVDDYYADMNERIDKIVNSPNTYTPADIEGTCYYISSINGKKGNDGLSPETAMASPRELFRAYAPGFAASILKPGDAVFFERGSVFHKDFEANNAGDSALCTVEGVIYTAYGEGPKPIFTGCLDFNGSMDWVETGHKNVWKLNEPLKLRNNDNPGYRADVGNIIFTDKDGKTGWGIMVYANGPENSFGAGVMSKDNAMVSNGYEVYDSAVRELKDPSCLMNNLEFFHDWASNTLYLYYDGGNPGKAFEKIIVSTRGNIAGAPSQGILDNLAFMYTGSHGIGVSSDRAVIQNCTLEWIGGSHQGGDSPTRFGNGIEVYGSSEGYTIKNCYVNQVYDGGISTQISTSDNTLAIQNNLEFSGNVITNTNSHIEIWNYGVGSVLANVRLTDNFLAIGGYHFGHQRPNKGGSLLYLGRLPGQFYENSVVENNVFMFAHAIICGRPLLARGESNGSVMRNNVYINSTKTRLGELQGDWHNDSIGYDAVQSAQMYTRENIEAMVAEGIDEGSVFYMTDDYFDPREADGLFYNRTGFRD